MTRPKKRWCVTAVLLLALCSGASFAQTGGLFHFAPTPGPHAVGLKVVEQYDYSRTFRHATDNLGKPYQGERARPLQTLVWYPAKKIGAVPMNVRDYANLAATEISFDKPAMSERAKERLANMGPTLDASLWATRDAPAAAGRFPVVIYAPSYSSVSWENADLCEYLASHGYVVIASPNMGATTREMTMDLVGVNAQATDISFLIGYAQTLPNTDVSAVAVAGFSWGGISNLFAAARDNRIDALIALDGSMRYWSGLTTRAGDVDPGQMTIPLLFFAQGEFSLEDQDRFLRPRPAQNDGPNVLNAWTHGDSIVAYMLGMTHRSFSSMIQRNEDMWKNFFPDDRKADYGREDVIASYGWVARYTLQFLDAYLKGDAAAVGYLRKAPAENGVPEHYMAVKFRAAAGVAPSLQAFRSEIGKQGFAHAADIHAAIRKDAPDFKLDEEAVVSWSNELLNDGHLAEAIALLELNVQVYPDSSGGHSNLGNAYKRSGQRQRALDSYRRALDKNANNEIARNELKALQGESGEVMR